MANTNAPFGFLSDGNQPGQGWDGSQITRKIASNYGTAIFTGDPVVGINSGYIGRGANNTTQLAGIFVGCEYLSTAVNRKVWSPYWPGSGASGDVTAYIINNPDAKFLAQSNNTAIGFADIGANIGFVIGTGNTSTGRSGAALDQSTIETTTTLPFRILGLYQDGNPNFPGGDSTSAYNWVYVGFNFVDTRTLVGV